MTRGRPAVLLLGNYRPTIVLARSLRALGWHVIVGLGGGEGGAEASRATGETWAHGSLESSDVFLADLTNLIARRPDIEVVLPVTEESVRVLAEHWSDLPSGPVFATPASRTVSICLDKFALFARAAQVGVPVAPWARVTNWDDLVGRVGEIGRPLVIRPCDSAIRLGGRKAITIGAGQELREQLPGWPAEHAALIVQRRVGGRRHNIYFAADRGKPLRLGEAVILRTDNWDGSGLAVEGMTTELSPHLVSYTTALLADLAYTGIGCAQFLVDPATGDTTFLEINPRIAGNHAIAEAAGLELGRLAVDLARGTASDHGLRVGRAGLRYAWTYGDLRGLVAGLRRRDIGAGQAFTWAWDILRTAATADLHVTWSWRDPMPTLTLFARQFRRRSGSTQRPSPARAPIGNREPAR